MLLAIDAGNTNVVFALVEVTDESREIKARWRIATDPRRCCEYCCHPVFLASRTQGVES